MQPYGFDVGQSERGSVLKGLDLGVEGMRVGGQVRPVFGTTSPFSLNFLLFFYLLFIKLRSHETTTREPILFTWMSTSSIHSGINEKRIFHNCCSPEIADSTSRTSLRKERSPRNSSKCHNRGNGSRLEARG